MKKYYRIMRNLDSWCFIELLKDRGMKIKEPRKLPEWVLKKIIKLMDKEINQIDKKPATGQ